MILAVEQFVAWTRYLFEKNTLIVGTRMSEAHAQSTWEALQRKHRPRRQQVTESRVSNAMSHAHHLQGQRLS